MQEIERVEVRVEPEVGAELREHGAVEGDSPVVPYAGYAEEISREDLEPQPLKLGSKRRALWTLVVMVAFGMAVAIPPLINVNQYQRRIVTSISASLGRPVHLDSVTLNVLPWPGFTLTNFVVSEDPSFGSEPVIRADSVRATLRVGSLWRRRIEFSRIALDDASVNLVRRSDGRWNVESILLQASRIPVVPTEQKIAGDAPRFPYIEATAARVNVKQGLEKEPISLTDTEFALWLAQPRMWRLRMEGHPSRTDTTATDSGVATIEGTLGKAETLEQVPVDLHAEWRAVPLGGASWAMLGRDIGLRGDMTVRASVQGTMGDNLATARLEVRGLRRADFIPVQAIDVDVSCKATAQAVFHRLNGLKCLWPPDAEQSGLGGAVITGDVPNIHDWKTARLSAKWEDVPMQNLVEVLRVASQQVSPDLFAGGTLDGEWTCCGEGPALGGNGNFTWDHARLGFDKTPLHLDDSEIPGELDGDKLTLTPISLNLGGPEPAKLMVQADASGMKMRLTGMVLRARAMALGKALPQFGEGLAPAMPEQDGVEIPAKVDLIATRAWGGAQTWVAMVVPKKMKRR
jgi:AsmA protein